MKGYNSSIMLAVCSLLLYLQGRLQGKSPALKGCIVNGGGRASIFKLLGKCLKVGTVAGILGQTVWQSDGSACPAVRKSGESSTQVWGRNEFKAGVAPRPPNIPAFRCAWGQGACVGLALQETASSCYLNLVNIFLRCSTTARA